MKTEHKQTRLCGLSFALWVARNCGPKSQHEREIVIRSKRHDLVMAVRLGRFSDCHKPQRDLINRRQLRAALSGVELYDRTSVCGIELAFPKWRNC